MTIQTEVDSAIVYTGNGSQVAFQIPYEFNALADIDVTLTTPAGVDVTVVSGGSGTYDFVTSGTYSASSGRYVAGFVTFNTAPPASYSIALLRDTADLQAVDLNQGGGIPPEAVERALDRRVMRDAEFAELFLRTPRTHPALGVHTTNMTFGYDGTVTGLPTPVAGSDAVPKSYLDSQIASTIAGIGVITGAPSVATIAALKALNTATTTSALVMGYYALLDGGGGHYVYDSGSAGPANNGTIVAPNSGSGFWRLAHHFGYVSCRAFGALGGDSGAEAAGNATTLQAWITAAQTEKFMCLWTQGVYQCNAQLLVSAQITMRGTGWAAELKCSAGSTHIPILLQEASYGAINGCSFQDFAINGNGCGQYNAALLNLNGATNVKVSHMLIKNGNRASGASGVNGISMGAGDPTGVGSSGVIEFCEITACSKAAVNISGSTAAFGEKVVVHANKIHDVRGNGESPGIQCNASGVVTLSYNNITDVEGCAVLITDGSGNDQDIAIIGGVFDSSCDAQTTECAAIFASAGSLGNVKRIHIIGVTCINTGTNTNQAAGINCSKIQNLVISGVICRFNKGDGARIQGCEDVKISGQFNSNGQVAPPVSFNGGIQFLGTNKRVQCSEGQANNDETVAVQQYGIVVGSGAVMQEFEVEDSFQMVGNLNAPFLCQGTITSGNIVMFVQKQTTAAPLVTLAQIIPTDLSKVACRIAAMGGQVGGNNVGVYIKATGAFYRSGGASTLVGGVPTLSAGDIETDATWTGPYMAAAGTECVAQIAGKAATTINWRAKIEFEVTSGS